jgi:membrane protease YdiL (CAAX protease family)
LFWLGVPRNGTGSFALYAVLVLGWLYDRSGGSVLPAVLLHTGVNTSGSVVPATMETLETFPLATDIAGTAGMVVLAAVLVTWGQPRYGRRTATPGIDRRWISGRE